ncbi:MAG TPA: lactate racemase domain-containing protein [Chloroflexia bacterium]|nr:lactate racemase domain-containing protein [Chloroflexia bacterium]
MFMKAQGDKFPRMVRLSQELYNAPLGDEGVVATVEREFARLDLAGKIGPGKKVALGAGSRGVASINLIIKTLVEQVKKLGGEPFVFPAMGSHGGGTAEGQRGMLEALGVTEEYIGCPIRATMEVVELGNSPSGLPVYLDKYASEADAIIITNRVKAHTNFRGHVESGLMKMLAIGAGKHTQAIAIHAHGVQGLRDYMPEVAREILKKAPIVAGFAVIEDAYHNASKIVGVAPQDFERTEERLLEEAKRVMPSLPVKELDLLIVEKMGKNISGTGMDTNVIGRCRLIDFNAFPEPVIKCIITLDLTEETHGNATGVGLADLVTRRLADKIDYQATYTNCITGQGPAQAALPIVMDTDQDAVRIALDYLVGPVPLDQLRAIRIKDTLSLAEIEVSEALMRELQGRDGFSFGGELKEMAFAEDGTLL